MRIRLFAATAGALALCVLAAAGPAVPAWGAPATTAAAATSDNLAGISCVSASFCMAVGNNDGTVATQVWNGSAWRVKPLAVPGRLTAVSCLSAHGCLAVGDGPSGGLLGEWWNGSAWRAVNPLSPAGATLSGVSCAATTSCIVVGTGGRGDEQAISEAWNGAAWRVLNTPNIGGPSSELGGVSCPGAKSCLAVGSGMPNDEGNLPMSMRWNGKAWRLLDTPPQDEEFDAFLAGVSCLTGMNCMAVGDGGGTNGTDSLAIHWNGRKWKELSTNDTGALLGVSCLRGGNCIAAGAGAPVDGNHLALAQEWDGGSWQGLQTQNPSQTVNTLNQVSCVSAVNCVAVGNYAAAGGAQLQLAETWNGTSWQTTEPPSGIGGL